MANGDASSTYMNKSAILDMIFKAAVVLLIPWAVFVTSSIFALKQDVAVITNTRFTGNDGTELIRQMIDMERSIRADMPPQEWRDRITKLESCQANLERNRPC